MSDFSDSLRGKKIFLTGGTGFFGKNLLAALAHLNNVANLGLKVLVLSRNVAMRGTDFIEYVVGDVRDFVFPRGEIDFVIHAATPASAKLEAENPAEMSSIIVNGTKRVVEFARKCGAKKLLLTSSGAVYGAQPPEIKNISEDFICPPNPGTSYGAGKLEAEKICADSFPYPTIARCFAFVGPHLPLDIHYAIGNFIRDGIAGCPIKIESDGRPIRSYLYSAELVVWLMTILLRGAPGRAYNVGSEREISIGDLAVLVSKQFSPPPVVNIAGKPDTNTPPPRYVPSTNRAREELGLVQKISLEESIKKTIEAYT